MQVKTSWFEIDDIFFEARGTAWALVHFLRAAELDFAEVLADKNAQTSVRQILSEAGLTISNSQVLPVREQDDFDYISIRLTVEGDLSALDAALNDIAKFRPLLLVETLEMRSLRSGRMAKGAQIITASLQLFSLRAIL